MNPRPLPLLACLCLTGCESREDKAADAAHDPEPAASRRGEFAGRPVTRPGGGDDPLAVKGAWFSSREQEAAPLPGPRTMWGQELPAERWVGYQVDLDHDGVNESITRSGTGKSGGPVHTIYRLTEGEWDIVGGFKGEEFLLIRRENWLDDIVVFETGGKARRAKTLLQFDGQYYRAIRRTEDTGREVRTVQLAPEPDILAQGDGWKSPLVGTWVMAYAGEGPGQIIALTINGDGTYHQVTLDVIRGGREDDAYEPVGAEVSDHKTGTIDLRTGREILPPGKRCSSFRSIHWTIDDGNLHWNCDRGAMGGEGVTYFRTHYQ